MTDDVVLNKKESVERCVRQIRNYWSLPSEVPFERDHLRQDAIALNLKRAAEQCIDLANHAVRVRRLGIPKDSPRLTATRPANCRFAVPILKGTVMANSRRLLAPHGDVS